MRRFELHQHNKGRVADGVRFDNGWCVVYWRTDTPSVNFYQSVGDVLHVHGGKSIAWYDDAGNGGD